MNLEDNERDPVALWAEIHRLRAQAKGPDGFETWMDAAISERMRRVDAEAALREARKAPEHIPYLPYLCDRADGVKGHYAIARMHPLGYREVWNLRGHGWSAFSDEILTLDEAIEALRKVVIPVGRGY